MKRFTKVLMFLLMFLCLGSLVACGGKTPEQPDEPGKPEEPEHEHVFVDGKCECGEEDPNYEPSIKDNWDCITVEEAINKANEAGDAGTSESFYVYGVIVKISNPTYGEMTITDGVNEIYVYGATDEEGNSYGKLTGDKPVVGDEIVLYGKLKTYKGTPELDRSVIKEFKHVEKEDPKPEVPTGPSIKDDFDCISIADAINKANEAGDAGTSEKFYVYGTIVKVINPTYGEMTISDGVNELYVYGATDEEGTLYGSLTGDKPIAGDEIVLYGKLKTYKGTPELDRSVIKAFKHVEKEIDINDYKASTILAARDAKEAEKVKLTGVVANITYANGMIPDGFILVDNTSSIYVYGSDIAQLVQVGNTITVAGEKTYYVLDSEKSNANKYGYKGCCQIEKGILVENDKQKSDFNKDWIEEVSVKSIMETNVSENITTKLYKVTALIKKAPGNGFTNYYINDLDGVTGSYVYTKCNGNDYSWLDEFDGKICTVYMTAINAKSTTSGCLFRFVPVLVENNNFTFDLNNTPEFVLKYYALGQFKTEYTGDPVLEVITSVNSTLLGFENATISYESSNTEVINFVNENDKLVMHTYKSGEVVITMKAAYNGKEYSEKVTIKVTLLDDIEALTVKEAIDAEDNTVVTVKGVVMSSLVNQTGFYLNDETGIIAVTCSSDVLAEIELGQMIVIEGTRIHRKKEPTGNYAGQTVINDAKLIGNFYGNHEYSKASFDTSKALKDLCNLDILVDYTTQVYVVKALVIVEESAFYTRIVIKSPDSEDSILLYSASANQYSWLKQYNGKEVEMELAICDWNSKGYKGCVVAATYEGVTTVNNLNFQ